MSHIRAVRTLIIMLMASILALTGPLHARIQLDIVEKFWNGDVELDVVTIVDSDVEASKSKVALLGITKPSRSSFSFRSAEWLLLIDLWSKVVKAQSNSWRIIGSMAETETLHASYLTVSAGPGVRFVISSTQKGTATFVLPREDMARFESALQRV